MRIRDISDAVPSVRYYGGRAGRKLGVIIDGEPWIAKYPRPGRELVGRHVPSYTSSPVAEWLGSHIYQSCGIEAHETMLAWHGGQVVCACKDFTGSDLRLVEFDKLKTTLSDELEGFSGSPSDGAVVFLSDVLSALELLPELANTPGVRERFWDMFVIDAFIKNPNRNNGNWGLLTDGAAMRLAPVYDNDSSLFAKRSASVSERRLGNDAALEEDAFGTNVSCYRLDDGTERGAAIHPFKLMLRSENPDLAAAVGRARASVNLEAINALIDDVPEEAYGRILMTAAQREAHKRLIALRYDKGILPAAARFENLGLL